MGSSTRSGTSVPWPAEVAVAALSGVVTAYLPVHRWTREARWALHGGVGATTAVAVAVMMRAPGVVAGPDVDREPAGVRASVAVALLVGTATAATSRGGEAADAWIERRLAARGVRRPRMWIGVGAVALTLVMAAADRHTAPRRAELQIVPGSEGGGGEPGVGG